MSNLLNKENLDLYFKELSKIYKKLNKSKVPVELLVVGGAAILLNYNFRLATEDVDCLFQRFSSLKDAIKKVGEKYDLHFDWINSDFTRTTSYSDKLRLYSNFYKEYNQVLIVRTVDPVHLVAMKLMAHRVIKGDLFDVVGIIIEELDKGNRITLNNVYEALHDLYDDKYTLEDEIKSFLESILTSDEKLYTTYKKYKEMFASNSNVKRFR